MATKPKRPGFFNRAGKWMAIGAIGASTLFGTPQKAKAQTRTPMTYEQATNIHEAFDNTPITIRKTNYYHLPKTTSLTNTAQKAKAGASNEAKAKAVAKIFGKNATGVSTNALARIFTTCSNVFGAKNFGTNELRRSFLAIRQALDSPRVRQAIIAGNLGEVEKAMGHRTIPADPSYGDEVNAQRRRLEIVKAIALYPKNERIEILNGFPLTKRK